LYRKENPSPSLHLSSQKNNSEDEFDNAPEIPRVLSEEGPRRANRIRVPSIKELEEAEIMKKRKESIISQEEKLETRCKNFKNSIVQTEEKILKENIRNTNRIKEKSAEKQQNFQKTVDQKYENYLKRTQNRNSVQQKTFKSKPKTLQKNIKSVKQLKPMKIDKKPIINTRKMRNNMENLIKTVLEHMKECPHFKRKLEIAGLI